MIKYDIVAKIGEYQKDGVTKNKTLKVGVVMEKDGKPFILLNRTFNPAALDTGKESVLLSLYEPKKKDNDYNQNKHTEAKGNAYVEPLDDSIPDFDQSIPF